MAQRRSPLSAKAMKTLHQPIVHCSSIAEVLELLEKDLAVDELRNLFPNLDGIDYLWTKGGTLIPSVTSPFSSPFLYRGQTRRYTPCLPGAFRGFFGVRDFRGLSPAQRARCFIDRVRLEEFVVALSFHPARDYAREIGLRLYPHALAQHYEMTTDRIDLTQDHRVAAFFATNARIDGVWSPVTDGSGVVYRLGAASFRKHFHERLEWIGKQALPRPGEQKALTLCLPIGMDFESLPVETYTFTHDESCGQRLNDSFNGGAALFPPDVMAEVAEAIRLSPTVPRQIVEGLLKSDEPVVDLIFDAHDGAATFLEKHSSVKVAAGLLTTLSESQRARAHAAVEQMRGTFMHGVGALAARKAKPDQFDK